MAKHREPGFGLANESAHPEPDRQRQRSWQCEPTQQGRDGSHALNVGRAIDPQKCEGCRKRGDLHRHTERNHCCTGACIATRDAREAEKPVGAGVETEKGDSEREHGVDRCKRRDTPGKQRADDEAEAEDGDRRAGYRTELAHRSPARGCHDERDEEHDQRIQPASDELGGRAIHHAQKDADEHRRGEPRGEDVCGRAGVVQHAHSMPQHDRSSVSMPWSRHCSSGVRSYPARDAMTPAT